MFLGLKWITNVKKTIFYLLTFFFLIKEIKKYNLHDYRAMFFEIILFIKCKPENDEYTINTI